MNSFDNVQCEEIFDAETEFWNARKNEVPATSFAAKRRQDRLRKLSANSKKIAIQPLDIFK